MQLDPAKFTTGEVTERRDLGPDLWTVRIRPALPIAFRAGQYVTVGVEQEGELLERPYSIVSAPEEPELELFIELVPEGLLTPHLHPLQVGAPVVLRPRCKGIFLKECPLPAADAVFVATVTGIAPFVSYLRRQRARELSGEWAADGGRVLCIQGASLDSEFGYHDELVALAAEAAWLTYVPTVSRPWLCEGWRGERGRVEDVLRKHVDALGPVPGSGAFLCGHPGMIAGARAILRRGGMDDRDIREEQYWPEGKEPGGR